MALTDYIRKKLTMTLPSGRVFFDWDGREEYTVDASDIVHLPDALFFPESEAEIIAAIRLCRELSLPVVFRGAGTGYSGGALATQGGLLVSIERLNGIKIDREAKTATVGPGVITIDIMKQAEAVGLFYPPDPASYDQSTIAGNVSENAGGLRCKKYGVTRDYVLSCRTVLMDGTVVDLDHRAPFGLLDVMIGNEGTLGVFSEITLRLVDLPRRGQTILAVFEKDIDAAATVAGVIADGIVPCAMEYMDRGAIACTNAYDPDHAVPEGDALLLFETDGVNAEIEAGAIERICRTFRLRLFQTTSDDAERDILWTTRRNLSNAVKHAVKHKIAEDICVPPSRLPELVSYVAELGDQIGVGMNCYGHAGDGNLHVNFLGMDGSPGEMAAIDRGIGLLFDRTLALGGTITGEHGIGITKRDYIDREFDTATLGAMRTMKKACDPGDLLNPGKIFPEAPS